MTNNVVTSLTIDEGERRVQSLIKAQLDELERDEEWKIITPDLANFIRHKIIRIAFGGYKVGLITRKV